MQFSEEYVVARLEAFGRTITETDIVVHAGYSRGHYLHHVGVEFCKMQLFNRPIDHGTITFAIRLTAREINPRAMTYDYERLRFPRPVFAGDTIRTTWLRAGNRGNRGYQPARRSGDGCESYPTA